jgi:hypothetical protein
MTDIGHPQGMKIPPAPLFQRGVLKSPFNKGGFRGIWFFTVKLAATLKARAMRHGHQSFLGFELFFWLKAKS